MKITAVITLVSGCLGILKNLSNDTQKLIERHDELVDCLQIQQLSLRKIEQKIDNQVLRVANKSNVFLTDALRTNQHLSRNNSLQAAYEGFTELICLDPNENTVGTSIAISNKKLIALGYLGRFTYYCLLRCYEDALFQIYQFTSKYPDLGGT